MHDSTKELSIFIYLAYAIVGASYANSKSIRLCSHIEDYEQTGTPWTGSEVCLMSTEMNFFISSRKT